MMAKKQNRNKGKAKPQQKQRRQQTRIRERATRDVQLMDQPQVDLQNALLQQAQEDYLRELQTGRSTFGGAREAIQGIEQPDFGSIANQLTGWMNGLAPQFSPEGTAFEGFDAAEGAAGGGYGGALAGASLGNIASDIARAQAAQAGAQREAIVGGRNIEDNIIQRMEDTMQQYRNTLQNIRADDPWQIESRTDDLTDQAFEQKALRQKMANDRAFSEWMQNYLGGQMGGGGGGNPGPPRGGNAGGGMNMPGQGTVSHANIDNYGGMAGTGHPNRAIQQQVREADYVNELPGWVRYAYNHGGKQALNYPDRRQLYGKLAPRLRRKFGPPGGPEVDIPGPFN
jgi:hypothetical protein